MALFNYATKEITLKIVYYGPGLSGKTTNLQYLHSVLNPNTRGKLLSLSTEADRTLFFDFLPVELGKLKDFTIRFQLYTVPGQVRYNATRKVVLKGADAVLFVADSQREMREQNIESLENMKENLSANNIDPDEIPVVLQYNKRDLRNILSVDELNSDLNTRNYRYLEASAIEGAGVEESFKLVTRLMIEHISRKHKIEIYPAKDEDEVIPKKAMEPTGSAAVSLQSNAPAPAVGRSEKSVRVTDPARNIGNISGAGTEDKPLERADTARYFPGQKGIEKVSEAGVEDKPLERADLDQHFHGPEAREVPVVLTERLDRIADEVTEIREILFSLKSAISEISMELRQLDGIKQETKKTNTILSDILSIFSSLKTKKTWFKLH